MNDETQQFKQPHDSKILGVSVRGIIVLLVVATVCLMSLGGLTVVEPLYTLAGLTVGYYFGQARKQ
jgi:hypothetical protein